MWNSGSLLRKSLILHLYLKFQSRRPATDWTIPPKIFLFCLSRLVNYLFIFSLFFFFSMKLGSCTDKLQEAYLMKSLCKKKACSWTLCPRNTYRYLSKCGFVGEQRRGELTVPTALLQFTLLLNSSLAAVCYLPSSGLALLSTKTIEIFHSNYLYKKVISLQMCLESAFKNIPCSSLQSSLTLRNMNPRFPSKTEYCNKRPTELLVNYAKASAWVLNVWLRLQKSICFLCCVLEYFSI